MSRIAHHQPAYEDLRGQFRKSYHLEMVLDQARTDLIQNSLQETLQAEHIFCELGCGTGIFSIEAARHCSRVYAVEADEEIAEIARENIDRSGLGDRIELVVSDAQNWNIPEKADVILAEMMSIWAVEEPQVTVANYARRELLVDKGQFLPSKVVNIAELGYFPFERRGIHIPAVIPLFTGMPRPHVMTESRLCRSLDFQALVDPDLSTQTDFEAILSGEINCVVLRSLVQMTETAVFSGSDSLMPPTVVPLARPLTVTAGTELRLSAKICARCTLQADHFNIEVSTPSESPGTGGKYY